MAALSAGRQRLSAAARYGVSVVSVATALGAGLLLQTYFRSEPFVSLFLCAIMLATWFGGAGPGVLATVLSLVAFDHFLMDPAHGFSFASGAVPRLVLLTLVALAMVYVIAAQRRTAISLRHTRDDLQAAVRDLQEANRSLEGENVERRRAEEAASRARRELQITVDTIPALAARYRADGSLDFVNQTWRNYTGLAQDSLQGQRWGVAIHPDDLPLVERAWRAHLPAGTPFQLEQRLRRADGEYRWHLVRRVPLRDESGAVVKWYGVGHDIEDQKRAELALRRSEAHLAEAQRLSRTGSFGVNLASGRISWSDETYRIFGLPRSVEPTLDLVLHHVHPDDREMVRRELARDADDYDFEHSLVASDGTLKHIHVRARRVKYASGDEMIGALMDVTAAKRAQEALQTLQAELAHVTRVTTLGEMSASIAHEVNQPLAAILSSGQAGLRWLDREVPDLEAARRALQRIVHDARRGGDVIENVRSLSKRAAPAPVELDINDLIVQVLTLLRPEAARHGVVLRLQLGADLPRVYGDRIQLQQVIINLVVNGLQAMTQVAERERVLVIGSRTSESAEVLISVEDVGAGVEPENLDRLFSPFYTTKPDGLGIGLSICRAIVEAHGGRIWASRNAGPGMTFAFTVGACGQAAGIRQRSVR